MSPRTGAAPSMPTAVPSRRDPFESAVEGTWAPACRRFRTHVAGSTRGVSHCDGPLPHSSPPGVGSRRRCSPPSILSTRLAPPRPLTSPPHALMDIIVVMRSLLCSWLLAAMAVPICCCTLTALANSERPANGHSCCGDPNDQQREPPPSQCDCGCGHDLLSQSTSAKTATPDAHAVEMPFIIAPAIARTQDGGSSTFLARACHDPPGHGAYRFLFLRKLRC